MTKSEARALRDEIKAEGLHCVIARKTLLPMIFTEWGEISFRSRDEWLAYRERRQKRENIRERLLEPRSPIEQMIDESCGITWDALKALGEGSAEK